MSPKIGENNFDLIRLFAATQVAVLHVSGYLSPIWHSSWIAKVLECFPGVPTFFFISGLLISRSYEKNSALPEYTRNRALRIFPALHVCVVLNLVAIALTGYFAVAGATLSDILLLYAAKTTLLQFYNPDFMRAFGDGVLNGSLWTICVELQFYFLIPIIYRLSVTGERRRSNTNLILLVCASLACNRLLYYLQPLYADANWWKLFRVSFLPWLYMFLCGVLVQRNFELLARHLGRRTLLVALPLYVTYALIMHALGLRLDNAISPLLFFPLIATIFIAAYTTPQVSKLLHGHDISYGIYIYHIPIMNMFLYYGLLGQKYTLATLMLSLIFALLSWFLVERPSLKRKRRPSHPTVPVPSVSS